jgi:glycosyltransferase involved in cell wall biosynthesis
VNVLMLVMSDVAHDSRVLREAAALADQGHTIHIVGKDVPQEWTAPRGVTVESVSGGTGLKGSAARGSAGAADAAPSSATRLRSAARWALLPQHRQRVWRTWNTRAEAAIGTRTFDVVHAHDFNVLRLAAGVADRSGARLVYDSHEWWSGRERHGRPTPLERALERHAERRLVRRADAVLTVSDGIADLLSTWRGAEVKVVRNTFPARPDAAAQGADAVEGPAGSGAAGRHPTGVVYAGRIGAGRDLETLLPAASAAGLDACLMGPVDREYLHRMRTGADGVRLEPSRPVDEVDDVLRRAGIAVVTLTDTCANHRMALPNKLFHAVRAGVPVVAADLPELRRMVTKYGLGQLYRPGDVESIRTALGAVVAEYPRWCEQVARAKTELSWERDAAVLVGVYIALAGHGLAPAGARSGS